MKEEFAKTREMVWSAGARAMYGSLAPSAQRSVGRIVRLLARSPFPKELESKLKKVENPEEPNMYYIGIGAKYVLFIELLTFQVVIMGIVEREGMRMLKRSMERA